MTAKPTLVAVAVVLVAGVGTAVLLGGSTETKTVTVTTTVTVAAAPGVATQPAVSPAAEPEGATTPEIPPADVEPDPDFERVVLDDELVTIDDTTRSTAGDDEVTLANADYGVAAQLQQGPLKNDSLRFDFESTCCSEGYAADYYQFEITVPDNATKLVSEMGFLKGEASGNRVKVAFYRNEYREGEQLRQRALSSSSEVAPVDLVVRGASKIIVRLVCLNPGRRWKTLSDDDPSFGFLDAHFE